MRTAVLELRAEAEASLAEAGARLQCAADDRRAAVDRIRRAGPRRLEIIDGRDLRDLLVGLLLILDRPTSVSELVRLVAAHGFTPPGRPSQAVSNAMRVEMTHGNVGRIARGRYIAH